MRPLTFLSSQDLDMYGNNEIDKLCEFYGEEQSVQWKENGDKERRSETSPPLLDPNQVKVEWHLAKQVVKAECYPRDEMWKLWHLLYTHHKDDFPNLFILARLALTTSVHTAGCERGFSVQNRILTTYRNKLAVETQRKIMSVKLSSVTDSFDYDLALTKWNLKHRRMYELKK